MDFTISPGFMDLPETRFSQAGTTAVTLIPSFASAMAPMAAITAAAPPISPCIPFMEADGFRLYPPASKHKPLPIRAIFSSSVTRPLYSITIICGACLDPLATARKAFMPRAAHSSLPRTVHLILFFSEISLAVLARAAGVITLAGSFTRSRAVVTAFAIMREYCSSFLKEA